MKKHEIEDSYIKDIESLSDSQKNKVIEVSEAIAKRFHAEADKESQLKWRILFQRTAPEMLPFIIYCIYVIGIGIYPLVKISDFEGTKFYLLLIALIIIMALPIFVLPKLPFKKWFSGEKEDENKTS
jgi:hypothetical protein